MATVNEQLDAIRRKTGHLVGAEESEKGTTVWLETHKGKRVGSTAKGKTLADAVAALHKLVVG